MPNNDFLVLLLPEAVDAASEAVAAAWRIESGIALRTVPRPGDLDFDRHWLRVYGDSGFCRTVAETFDLELEAPQDDLLSLLEPRWTGGETPGSLAASARAFIANGSVAACHVHEGDAGADDALDFAQAFAGQIVAASAFVADIGLTAEGKWVVTGCAAAWDAGLKGCDPAGAAHALRYASRARARKERRERERGQQKKI
jgi:hypothetical protein